MITSFLRMWNTAEALKELQSHKFYFSAALSSEDRSTAWAEKLAEEKKIPFKVLLFDYSRFIPRPPAEAPRVNKQLDFLSSVNGSKIKIEERTNPFSLTQLSRHFEMMFEEAGDLPIVIDYTCMTVIHILALVSTLVSRPAKARNAFLCYTIPRIYGFKGKGTRGWKDVLFVPVGTPAKMPGKGYSQGLILAGHDEERLSVALQECEPDGGVVLYTATKERPDFLRRAREVNRGIIDRLLGLTTPAPGLAENDAFAWEDTSVVLEAINEVERIARRLAETAKQRNNPVVMFPFGPRLSILTAAYALSSVEGVSAWAVCPIPSAFRIDVSNGSGHLFCVSPV